MPGIVFQMRRPREGSADDMTDARRAAGSIRFVRPLHWFLVVRSWVGIDDERRHRRGRTTTARHFGYL